MSTEVLRARLRADIFDHEALHGLFERHHVAGEVDAAWCLAHALSFLKKATRAEESFHEEHRPRELRRASQRLSEAVLRRHVTHPEQDLLLTCVFGLLARAVAMWRATETPPQLRLYKRIDVTTDGAPISRMIAYLAEKLDVPPPELYLRPEESGDAIVLNLHRDGRLQPTLAVFRNLLGARTDSELAFTLGRSVLDLYPPHFCSVALDRSPPALQQVLTACLRGAGLPVRGDEETLDVILRELFGRMQPETREQLRGILRRIVETGGSMDVERWALGVELTGYRMGLLLCGDLGVAGRMISQEQSFDRPMTLGPRDKIKALVEYACSEDYVAARRAIGVSVGG